MALGGPQLRYTRVDHGDAEETIGRALRLAHQIEELLERAPASGAAESEPRAHSTRIARAMAASLVDELEAIVRGARKGGVATG